MVRATGDSRLDQASGVADMASSSKPGGVARSQMHDASEPPAQQFRAQSGVSAARAAGATVLLDVRSGLYHTLNEPASHVWDAIESGDATLSTLVDVLAAEYDDVPRATIARDVKRLLDTFLEAGLISMEPVQ